MGILSLRKFRNSRRKFLMMSSLAAGSLVLLKQLWPQKKSRLNTRKFLTHDGRVVEVEIKHLAGKGKPVSKEQLIRWIWKNQEIT